MASIPKGYPSEHSHVISFQHYSVEHDISQPLYSGNAICSSINRGKYASKLCYFNPEFEVNAPVLKRMDTSKNTFTGNNFPITVSWTPSPPSTSGPVILNPDGFNDISSLFEANTSATSAHTQLPDWYTGGPRFVRQMGPVQPLADVQKPDPVHVHDLPASPCRHSSGSATHAKSSEDAQEAFTRILPSLQDVHSGNLGTFLIELLKETHDHVPLQDFYCILYTDNSQEYIRALDCEGANLNHQYYHKTLTGIKLQHLVLERFKSPERFQTDFLKRSPLSTVNLHEFLRNFLAIKILFGCIQNVDDPSQTLPRALIYKAYYILCQKVFLKHPEISKSLCSPQSHILGQARVGILTKLMHPNLVCRRLGKRGQSKSHYIGLIWNESMVDADTIRLVNLDITDLRDYFQDQWQPAKRIPVSRHKQMGNNQELYSSSNPVPMISPIASSYSFVDFPYDPIVTNLRAKRTGTGPPGRASPRVFLDR